MIYLCVSFGILLGMLTYSNYFIIKVSKGLPLTVLYNLVVRDPIEDHLLYYTFYNLLVCRICLILAWLSTAALGGLYYGLL